jgi:DnaJ-domain-containing protein 1
LLEVRNPSFKLHLLLSSCIAVSTQIANGASFRDHRPDSAAARYTEWATELFGAAWAAVPGTNGGATTHDFDTMTSADFWANSQDITGVDVSIVSLVPASAVGDLVEISVDVSETPLRDDHVAPGQFVQLGLRGARGRRGIFTISSPPGPGRNTFQFLVSPGADPLRLCNMKVGQVLRMSRVAGDGFECTPLVSGQKLHAFADCAQGFAALNSLVEWDSFKAASGSGANRTTRTSIYYSIPSPGSLPYPTKMSNWATYGVNLVPIVQQSLSSYVDSFVALQSATGFVGNDGAVFCVADIMTAFDLIRPLNDYGVVKTAFHSFTQQRVRKELSLHEKDGSYFDLSNLSGQYTNASRPRTKDFEEPQNGAYFQDDYEDTRRGQVEDQIWEKWVHIRSSMRKEFESKWAQTPSPSSQNGSATEGERASDPSEAKKRAWESWFETNKDAWRHEQWDDVKWDAYWSTWQEEQDKWSSKGNNSYSSAWGNSTRSNNYWSSNGESSSSTDSGRAGAGWGGWTDNRSYNHTRQRPWGGRREPSGEQTVDFYQVLGLKAGASGKEIKLAYRQKALEFHPDVHPELGQYGTERMQEVVVAYMTLKDPRKRVEYDRYGV